MRQPFRKSESAITHAALPVMCALSAAILATLVSAQEQPAGAIDPFTRAKEIAALAPSTERTDLRKEEIKELSVVMSGVELVLRDNIEKLLDIWQFHEEDIPSVSRMRFMHRQAPDQIASALKAFGYYRSTVEASLNDLGSKWQAVYRIKPGDRVPVKNASIKIIGPGADEPDFRNLMAFAAENIRREQLLDQQSYDALKSNIRTAAATMGYFDSEFTDQEILIDVEDYGADVTLHFTTGERYKIGEITVTQDRPWLSDEIIARYIDLQGNDFYDAGAIQKIQSDFSNTPYYRNVQVRASADDAVEKVIPVDVDLTHRNPKQYVYGVGFGTDTGARLRFGVTRRRVNSEGHHYEAQAILSEIGYGLGYSYIIPTRDPRTDSYGFNFNIEEEDTTERHFRNIGVGGFYSFRDENWLKTYSLDYEVEENVAEDQISTLFFPTAEWLWTSPVELVERLNVERGSSFEIMLRGASNSVLSDTSFIQAKLTAKTIFSYSNGNRFIARGSVGSTAVSDFALLPLSKRFYTGGDNTVRGYDFNVIAPEEDNELVGGRHLVEASIEYEVPFRPSYSWAVFMDAGDAFDDEVVLRNSIGAGIRWRSPIGPIRFDAARGLDEPNNGVYEFHINIGPDL